MTTDMQANRPAHLRSPEAWASYLEECREQNEAARERQNAAQEQAHKDEAAQVQARHDEAARVEVEQFKTVARAAFPGTAAEFEEQWPQLLGEHQRQQTLARLNGAIERKRALYEQMLF